MKRLGTFAMFLWRDHHATIAVVGVATLALSLTEGVGLLMLVPIGIMGAFPFLVIAVLAAVGSDRYGDRNDGAINFTRAIRSPGSTLKPFQSSRTAPTDTASLAASSTAIGSVIFERTM